jgi:hypothetical protein
VNPPEIENGRFIVHPADADITWINQSDENNEDVDMDMSSTFNQPSFSSSGRDSIPYSDPNVSQLDQNSFRNDTISSHASSQRSQPSFVVKRPMQPKFSVKTRAQKRNVCDSILPLKGCKQKVKYVSDANTSMIQDLPKLPKFACHMCEKRYSYKHSLNRHLNNIHKLTKEDIVRLKNPPQLAIEYMRNVNDPNVELINPNNIPQAANTSWIKPGKRSDTQAGFRKRRDDKFKRVMTVGVKRDRKIANLDESLSRPDDKTFKNWKV